MTMVADGGTSQIDQREVAAVSIGVGDANKALVLEAFEVLFNKRDYTAAARYWSDDYIQHSMQISCPLARPPRGPAHADSWQAASRE
jgi:hypothetical protein